MNEEILKEVITILQVLSQKKPITQITSPEIAKILLVSGYKLNERTVRKYLAEAKKRLYNSENWFRECQKLIDFYSPVLDKPYRLTGDWVITSDYHIPTTRLDWVDKMFSKASQYQVSNLLIAGDLFNFDILSLFNEKDLRQTISLSDEILISEKILNEISLRFKNIVWIFGNHEKNRLLRVIHHSLDAKQILNLLKLPQPQWTVSPTINKVVLSYCYLDDIRIEHPQSYSQIKLAVARKLSEKYRCSVLQAHGHFFSLGFSPGHYIIGDTGGFMDASRTAYLFERGSTTHPQWNVGFMIYKNKKILPFAEGIGD